MKDLEGEFWVVQEYSMWADEMLMGEQSSNEVGMLRREFYGNLFEDLVGVSELVGNERRDLFEEATRLAEWE